MGSDCVSTCFPHSTPCCLHFGCELTILSQAPRGPAPNISSFTSPATPARTEVALKSRTCAEVAAKGGAGGSGLPGLLIC